MRRTKIVATIGPASSSLEIIRGMIAAGMNCARLNFSHGTHAEHELTAKLLRQAAQELQRPLAILLDLAGPKIRLGALPGGEVHLGAGDTLIISTAAPPDPRTTEVPPAPGGVRVPRTWVTLPTLHKELQPGQQLLLQDGDITVQVTKIVGKAIHTQVQNQGVLRSHAGVNLPGVKLSLPALTEKDQEDLTFGLKLGVDYVALSFVRRREDVTQLKELLHRQGKPLPVIAKIEKPEALDNLEAILAEAEGVMVARGDLGVEMPLPEIPLAQKRIIHRANLYRRLVITATQMLESMTEHPRPTRAEVSDVANAVLDGTDAVMLSEETAQGHYPQEAVAMMAKIIAATEEGVIHETTLAQAPAGKLSIPEAVADAAFHAALDVGAKAIVAFTQSGQTALLISKYRPPMPVLAFTPQENIRQRLGLYWGVEPLALGPLDSTDRMVEEVEKELLRQGYANRGDQVVILAGAPVHKQGATNLMKIHKIE